MVSFWDGRTDTKNLRSNFPQDGFLAEQQYRKCDSTRRKAQARRTTESPQPPLIANKLHGGSKGCQPWRCSTFVRLSWTTDAERQHQRIARYEEMSSSSALTTLPHLKGARPTIHAGLLRPVLLNRCSKHIILSANVLAYAATCGSVVNSLSQDRQNM